MDEQLKRKLQYLSSGTTKEYLLSYLTYIKDQVADVRTRIAVRPEIENDVRRGVIQVIDELMIDKLRLPAKGEGNNLYN